MKINTLRFLTCIEWIYLLYMFFFLKTSYHIEWIGDRFTSSYSWLIHHTDRYESKICMLGKILVVFFLFFTIFRLYHPYRTVNITFDFIGILLAFLMNWNALVYLLPLFFIEGWIIINDERLF